jgi:Mrp family chromosome partitioning ATPase
MGVDLRSAAGSSSSKEQSVGPILQAVGRHWLVVLIVAGIATGIAVFTILGGGATYESSAVVLVNPLPETDASYIGTGVIVDSGDPTRTIQTAAVLVSTPSAAAAAAEAMGSGWTLTRVQDAVRVEPRGESSVLSITAKGSTSREAARLANTYATAAVAERGELVQRNLKASTSQLRDRLTKLRRSGADQGQLDVLNARFEDLRALQALGSDPSLQLSQRADIGGGPVGISSKVLLMLAVLSGLILGIIAALALEYFTRRIRDEDEITRLYPVPILAGIPKIPGARSGRVNPQALPPPVFEQIRLLRAQLPLGRSTSIMITSANSGDGKTTTATALATAIVLSDQDVILLDLDSLKPSPTSMFGIARPLYRPQSTDPLQLEQMLEPVLGVPHLRVMPAPLGDHLLLEPFLRQVPGLLAEAKRLASCVIVDAPPVGEVGDALRIATACDHTVFVVRPRRTHRARLILTRDMLTRAGVIPIGIVVVGQRTSGSSHRYDNYEFSGIDLRQAAGVSEPGESAVPPSWARR